MRIASIVIKVISALVFLTSTSQAAETVIDADHTGTLKVSAGDSLTVTNGANIYGDIKIEGGNLTIIGASIVHGKIIVSENGSFEGDNFTLHGNLRVIDGDQINLVAPIINGMVRVLEAAKVVLKTGEIKEVALITNSGEVEVANMTFYSHFRVIDSKIVIVEGSKVSENLRIQEADVVVGVLNNRVTRNLRLIENKEVVAFGNEVGENFRMSKNEKVLAENNTVSGHLRAIENLDTTIQNNTISQKLKLIPNGVCSESGNTYSVLIGGCDVTEEVLATP